MTDCCRQGTKVRADLAAKGAELRAERDAKLIELEPGRAELEAKQAVLEELKNQAEEPEKEAKTAFDTAWDETRNANRAAARNGLFKHLDTDGTETIELAEVLAKIEFDADADGQVTPEEANTFFDQDADGELNETEAVMPFERFEEDKYATMQARLPFLGGGLYCISRPTPHRSVARNPSLIHLHLMACSDPRGRHATGVTGRPRGEVVVSKRRRGSAHVR